MEVSCISSGDRVPKKQTNCGKQTCTQDKQNLFCREQRCGIPLTSPATATDWSSIPSTPKVSRNCGWRGSTAVLHLANWSRICPKVIPCLARTETCITRLWKVRRSYIYRRSPDGGAGEKVTSHPVVRLQTISPDGKWLVAESPIGGEDAFRGVEAFNVGDATIKRICSILCIVRWSGDGKLVYISLSRSGENVRRYRTFIVPLRHGSAFPDLPATGIKAEADLERLNGVKVVDDLLHPGPDGSRYAFDRESDHRNIYRIPIPN